MERITNTKIFSGNSNPQLSYQIAGHLGLSLGNADVTQFSDGEIRVEVFEYVRNHHVFIIQSTCKPTNDNLMEMLIMVDALRRSAVKSITAVIPYYGYSRQDRRPGFTRTPITSRLVADMIEKAGVDTVITVDIHSTQQQGFFTIPVVNISAGPEIVGDIYTHHCEHMKDMVIISPDTGGVVRARSIAKQLDDADLAIIDKRRPEANVSEVMNVIGNVEGRRCIIIDDLIDTAGTLAKGAKALKEHGATHVYAYATHPVLSGEAYNNIKDSDLDEVVISDTIPLPYSSPKIRVVSVAHLLGETISRIRQKKSISQIYTGS